MCVARVFLKVEATCRDLRRRLLSTQPVARPAQSPTTTTYLVSTPHSRHKLPPRSLPSPLPMTTPTPYTTLVSALSFVSPPSTAPPFLTSVLPSESQLRALRTSSDFNIQNGDRIVYTETQSSRHYSSYDCENGHFEEFDEDSFDVDPLEQAGEGEAAASELVKTVERDVVKKSLTSAPPAIAKGGGAEWTNKNWNTTKRAFGSTDFPSTTAATRGKRGGGKSAGATGRKKSRFDDSEGESSEEEGGKEGRKGKGKVDVVLTADDELSDFSVEVSAERRRERCG